MEVNVAGESNCEKDDFISLAKKSGVGIVRSFPYAVQNSMENECEHFSIRGYVSEVRKKDMKICWPFPTVRDHNKLKEQMLPHLHVPQFRWWQCQICLGKTEAKENPMETGVVKTCRCRVCENKTSTSSGILFSSSCGDAQKLHSSFQESSEVNIADPQKSRSDVSLPVKNGKDWLTELWNNKKKRAGVVDLIMEGEKMNSSASPSKVDKSLAAVSTNGIKFNITIPIAKKGYNLSSNDTYIANTVMADSSNKRFQKKAETHKLIDDECSKEIRETGNPGSSRSSLLQINEGNREGVTSSAISEADEASTAVVHQTSKLHSVVSINSSSEDENLAGEDFQDQHHVNQRDGSGDTSHGNKPRKVRSLTDIIRREMLATPNELHNTEREPNTDHKKIQVSQSKSTPEESPRMSLYPIINNQVTFQGSDENNVLGKKKECKRPRNQDEGSSRMNWQRGETEKPDSIEEDSETRSMDAINADGEPTGDASFLPVSYFGSKVILGKHRNDKELILDGEKKEISPIEGRLSSSAHHFTGIYKKAKIRKDAEINGARSELIPIINLKNAISGTDVNPGAQVYAAQQKKEKCLALDKNKNKVPQVEVEKSSIMPGQEGMSRKDLILKRYLGKKHKDAPSDSFNSVRDPSDGRSGHGPKRQKQSHREASLCDRQKNLPQVNECEAAVRGSDHVRSPLICQPKDASSGCHFENAAHIKEPSKLSMDQCEKMAKETDNMPMEIVELMARNQHERLLDYAKGAARNRYWSSVTAENNKDTGLVVCTDASRLPHEKFNLQKSLSCNAKDIGSGSSMGLTKKKSVACPSTAGGECYSVNLRRNQPEQAQASSGFKSFAEHQEKIPSQLPYPAIGSRSFGIENCSQSGNMVVPGYLSSSVQSLHAYRTSQAILPQSSIIESQSVWPKVPCQMPSGSNSPQKSIAEVGFPNRLFQSPVPLPVGNVNWDHTLKPLNLKASHLQKRKGSSEIETDMGLHSEHLFARTGERNVYPPTMRSSLDLHNNETLSATNLLRLMHAGVRPVTPVNMSNNQGCLRKDPLCAHDQIINKLPGPAASKTNGALVSSFNYHGRNDHLGKSCEHFPPVSVASLAQKDASFERATVSTNENFPLVSIAKGVDSLAQTQGPRHVELKVNGKPETVSVETNSGILSCTLNRNPADFTTAEDANVYMIGAAEMKRKPLKFDLNKKPRNRV